jgi:hypothetical protein
MNLASEPFVTRVSNSTGSPDWLTGQWKTSPSFYVPTTLQEPSIAVDSNDERTLLRILLVVLEKSGGRISVSDEELAAANGHVILSETDAAGFRHVDLLPDYVAIGEPEEVPVDPIEVVYDPNDFGSSIGASWVFSPFDSGTGTITGTGTISTPSATPSQATAPSMRQRGWEAVRKMSAETAKQRSTGGSKRGRKGSTSST